MFAGKAELTLGSNTFQVLHSFRLWPYPQTLDESGQACQEQTLKLNEKMRNLRRKKFYNIGPGPRTNELEFFVPVKRFWPSPFVPCARFLTLYFHRNI